MATIRWEEPVAVPTAKAWALLRRVDRAHELFAPVLVAGSMEDDVRTVTFANGLVVQERIVTVDDQAHRIAYTVLGEMFEHHSASMQILPVDDAMCRFVWISDFLPDERTETVRPLVEQGSRAFAKNIEDRKIRG